MEAGRQTTAGGLFRSSPALAELPQVAKASRVPSATWTVEEQSLGSVGPNQRNRADARAGADGRPGRDETPPTLEMADADWQQALATDVSGT
jgi:hypothetical protein